MTASLFGLIVAVVAGLFGGASLHMLAGLIRQFFGASKAPNRELIVREILATKNQEPQTPALWQRLTLRKPEPSPQYWVQVEAAMSEIRQNSKQALEILMLGLTQSQLEQLRDKIRRSGK